MEWKTSHGVTILNMIFSVMYYLELHNTISFYYWFYLLFKKKLAQVKLLMFYNVQPTNLTFVGKTWDIQQTDRALRNFKTVSDAKYDDLVY